MKIKNTLYRRSISLGAMAAIALLPAVAQAAAVAATYNVKTGSSNTTTRTLISVTSGAEGYSLTNGGTLSESFNGAIADYAFLGSTNNTGSLADTGNTTRAESGGGGLLSFSAGTWGTFGGDYTHLWTTNTPDVTLSNPNNSSIETRGLNIVTSVDISGATSGSVYIFYGFNKAGAIFDVNLSGAGQTSVFYDNLVASPTSGNNQQYVARFDFTDAAAYDTLDITMGMSNNSQSNSRFAGAVVTNVVAVPEPSAALLGGLGALLLLRRRRI